MLQQRLLASKVNFYYTKSLGSRLRIKLNIPNGNSPLAVSRTFLPLIQLSQSKVWKPY